MAKQLTEEDKAKIKDSVIASCIAKGLKPTTKTSSGVVSNPMYANCVQLGYQDALKNATEGKLKQWFNKVNSYVQSQGGITGYIQGIASAAAQYRNQTADLVQTSGVMGSGQFPPGYSDITKEEENGKDNTSLWIFLVILLLVLIIATVIYFNSAKAKS